METGRCSVEAALMAVAGITLPGDLSLVIT